MSNSELCNLLFVSFNAKGLGQELKRKKVFMWARDRRADILMLQETHSGRNEERIWKSQWSGAHAVFSHGETNSRGVCILMNQGLEVVTHDQRIDEDGRCILWKGLLQKSKFIVMNVYAPNKTCEQIQFYTKLHERLADFYDPEYQVILGGDFNVVLDPKWDKNGGNFSNRSRVVHLIHDLVADFGLMDVWRTKNPYKRQYSWEQNTPNVKCRLDLFLMSVEMLQVTKSCVIVPDAPGSDHKALMMKLQGDKFVQRGPGFWKLNNQILGDENFQEIVTQAIAGTLDFTDAQARWELIKYIIRSESQKYCVNRAKAARFREDKLKGDLQLLENRLEQLGEAELQQYKDVKEALSGLYDRKAEGAILRARARWLSQGEKNTKYFLGLEKRNYNRTCINQLDLGTNRVTASEDIQNALYMFYSQLFTSSNPDVDTVEAKQFLNNDSIPKLDIQEAEGFDQEITLEECRKALFAMKPNKTPGSDGLSVEFYQNYWETIKQPLFMSYLQAYRTGSLSDSQTHGIIRLIPKQGKNQLLLANWRPITLLNVDYKILSAVFAARIRTVIRQLVHEDQTGFVPGRQISQNTRLLLDLMDHLEEVDEGAFLIALDIELF